MTACVIPHLYHVIQGARYQRQMLWAIVTIWVVVMVPGAYFMFQHSFEQLFGTT